MLKEVFLTYAHSILPKPIRLFLQITGAKESRLEGDYLNAFLYKQGYQYRLYILGIEIYHQEQKKTKNYNKERDKAQSKSLARIHQYHEFLA